MKKIFTLLCMFAFVFALSGPVMAQENKKAVSEMTKEELSTLTYQDLLSLSLEDLMVVANKFGLSADEILEYFLNKDVTSASKRAEKSIHSPLSTTVISREEILNSGATSIPEALRLVPGMIIREKTPGNYDVHIRGNDNLPPKGMFVYSENSISLVMIDSRPVYNYAFGGTFWETLPIDLNDVERIEVIRGPSSALYGPNAVSGAINIITRNVENKKIHADGQAQLGTNNAILANGAVSFGTDKLKVRLSGNYTHFDRFENDFYVFEYNKRYTASEMTTLTMPTASGRGLVEANFNDVFPHPSQATEKYGANAFLTYDASKNAGFNMAFGAQGSDIISSTLGNNNIPIVPRTSNTRYIDFRAKVYGLQAQVNYMSGDQDIQNNYQGWHIAPNVFNSTLEYEYTLGTLVIRPGISFQSTTYDDSKWGNASLKDGFLNGPKTLSSFAYYLRADYKMFDKLRLIAAVRGDKYNAPDVNKFTYQFITSYDINENNIIRAGYSQANRGPFIADTYADYYWDIIPHYYQLHYEGNQNLNLPTMNMFEVGYRSKISKNVMVELEAFHSVLKDLSFWTPDEMSFFFNLGPVIRGVQNPATLTPIQIKGHGQYQNLDLESVQNGITLNVSVVINSKLNFKVFGTLQDTKLSHFYDRTIWQDFSALQGGCSSRLVAALMDGTAVGAAIQGDTIQQYSVNYASYQDSSNVSMSNKSTPSFYGGLTINYAPTAKWNFNSSIYFYSQQTMLNNRINEIGSYVDPDTKTSSYDYRNYDAMYKVDPKVIMNLKVSYKFWKDCSVFVNARNALNNESREFAFLDKVKAMYLVGLNFSF